MYALLLLVMFVMLNTTEPVLDIVNESLLLELMGILPNERELVEREIVEYAPVPYILAMEGLPALCVIVIAILLYVVAEVGVNVT